MASAPSDNDPAQSSQSKKSRLVLCFDGTGNKFMGNESDTNIVKIYQLLDRTANDQFHYYQPGIGTYSANTVGSLSAWQKFKAHFTSAVDQGIGGSFDAHVIAGYKFLMRYYNEGDAIYIFGFSRGSYTARFLSEMVQTIGLLSRGNEEMVQFAWLTFSDFQETRGNYPPSKADTDKKAFMVDFKESFCRPGVSIYFLGLFDCVNSVAQFEIPFNRKSYSYIAKAPAEHIRHALSIHERRLKFKPALFQQDGDSDQDIVEMWFAGNHGDVGGGWGLEENQKRLLSDTPLAWMLGEVRDLADNPNPLKWRGPHVESLERREVEAERALTENQPRYSSGKSKSAREWRKITSRPHDMLSGGHGGSSFGAACWWILEILPFFTRLELELGKWIPRSWPPNLGARRDIPLDANIHHSVQAYHRAGVLTAREMPVLGGHGPPKALLANADLSVSFWTQLREARARAGQGPNGKAAVPAKSWTGADQAAKCWSWD